MPAEVRSRLRLVLAGIAAWVILTFAFAIPEYILRILLNQRAGWPRVILGIAPHFIIWANLALVVAWLVRRWPIARPHLAARAALYFVVGLLCYVAEGAITSAIMPALLRDPNLTPALLRILFIRTFYDDFLLYWFVVGTLHLVRYQRRLAAEERTRAALQQQLSEAQLSALRSQLQPHFLFNTLNSIAELLHADAQAAERMVTRLSELLRLTLSRGDRQEIVLREELEMLELYLGIQQVRFGDTIRVERDVEPAALACMVPTLVLQPLVENSFRHGFSRRRRDARLLLRARRDGERLALEVSDNGGGLGEAWIEGIGLGNTRGRLAQLYGAAQTMTVSSAADGGTRVAITLPCRRETIR